MNRGFMFLVHHHFGGWDIPFEVVISIIVRAKTVEVGTGIICECIDCEDRTGSIATDNEIVQEMIVGCRSGTRVADKRILKSK